MIQNIDESQLNTEAQKTEAPSLVNTRQGVSVLYKNHFLYSKYDPSKAILNIISNLTIPEYSVVEIFSPVLWLGLKELIAKIPQTSCIAAFEYDPTLFDFSVQNFPKEFSALLNDKIKIFNKHTYSDYLSFIQKQHFRKTIRIDFSAGTSFYRNEYDQIHSLTQNIIDQYWKNRLTIIKFGRLFSKNIFKNLRHIPHAINLESLYRTVNRPVLVLGAGESLDKTAALLKDAKDLFFILAVDAAASPLMDRGIIPDAIVAVEGQQVIEKAYIGKPASFKTLLIMDFVSRSHIPDITQGPVSFFTSKYEDMEFLERLKESGILPPVVKPLGSVGLVAMEIALALRKDIDVPVYFSGLDFSYSPGITHAKGTPAHKNSLLNTNRIKSIFNYGAAFGTGSFWTDAKNSKKMITSKALQSYALLFTELFSDQKNIFDIGTSGIDLQIEKVEFEKIITSTTGVKSAKPEYSIKENPELKSKIQNFIKTETEALQELKDLFTQGEDSRYRNKELPLKAQIDSLLNNREYLYIHFPDAIGPTNPQSFYNRIRIELDFFQKELTIAQSLL